MFRLECFVDDNKIANVLHLLSGMVKGLDIQSVHNVVEKPNGELAVKTDGSVLEMFTQYMKEHPGVINAKYAKDFQRSIGRSETGYSHLIKRAIDDGLIVRRGKGASTTYDRVAK